MQLYKKQLSKLIYTRHQHLLGDTTFLIRLQIVVLLLMIGLTTGCTEQGGISAPSDSSANQKVVTLSFSGDLNAMNPMYTDQWQGWIMTAFWLERPWNFDENAEPYPVHLVELPTLENGGVSQDGLTITFNLKEGLTWSDGQPYTSADWVFTWQMYVTPKNTVLSRYPYDEFVDNVTAPDPLTVVVTLKKPLASWQSSLFVKTNGGTVVPKHILEPMFEKEGTLDNASWNRAPTVGIGPFIFKEYESGSYILFERNPNYYGQPPKIDKIFVRILNDDAAQTAALKAGEIDIAFVSFSDIPGLKASGLKIMSAASGYNEGLFLNMRPDSAHPAMLDAKVRQALVMGIDREQLAKDVLAGLTTPNLTFWDGSAWVNPDLKPHPYDPEAAKSLLDEAGWTDTNGDGIRDKDGTELILRHVATNRTVRKDYQAVIQQQLKQIGIGIELFNFSADIFLASFAEGGICATGQGDLCEISRTASFPDPDTSNWLCNQIPTQEKPFGGNYFICDEALDKLFQAQAVEVDPVKRRDFVYQIQKIIHDEVYYIGLWEDRDQWAVNPRLTGIKFAGVNPFFTVTEWDITEN